MSNVIFFQIILIIFQPMRYYTVIMKEKDSALILALKLNKLLMNGFYVHVAYHRAEMAGTLISVTLRCQFV